ncbi:hypothetical protein [Pseudomonas sp. TE3610]
MHIESEDDNINVKSGDGRIERGLNNITIDGADDGWIYTSYFDAHDFTTLRLTLPESQGTCDRWDLSVVWVTVLGHEVGLHAESDIRRPLSRTFDYRLSKASILDWFSRSIGEGTRAIRWKFRVKAVFLSRTYTVETDFLVTYRSA